MSRQVWTLWFWNKSERKKLLQFVTFITVVYQIFNASKPQYAHYSSVNFSHPPHDSGQALGKPNGNSAGKGQEAKSLPIHLLSQKGKKERFETMLINVTIIILSHFFDIGNLLLSPDQTAHDSRW